MSTTGKTGTNTGYPPRVAGLVDAFQDLLADLAPQRAAMIVRPYGPAEGEWVVAVEPANPKASRINALVSSDSGRCDGVGARLSP